VGASRRKRTQRQNPNLTKVDERFRWLNKYLLFIITHYYR
jgi:hypothetical protein